MPIAIASEFQRHRLPYHLGKYNFFSKAIQAGLIFAGLFETGLTNLCRTYCNKNNLSEHLFVAFSVLHPAFYLAVLFNNRQKTARDHFRVN